MPIKRSLSIKQNGAPEPPCKLTALQIFQARTQAWLDCRSLVTTGCGSALAVAVHEMPPLKQGATLPQPDWPGIETERLILRQ